MPGKKPSRDDYPAGDAGTRQYEAAESAWRKSYRDIGQQAPGTEVAPHSTGKDKDAVGMEYYTDSEGRKRLRHKSEGTAPTSSAEKPKIQEAGDPNRPVPPGENAGLAEQIKYRNALKEYERRKALKGMSAGSQAKAMSN